MKWEKMGQVYCPSDEDSYTHAMFPVVEILDPAEGQIRIYYTHRDRTNYGFPTFMDASIVDGRFSIKYNHHEPILEKADLGNFDDSGVNITSVVKVGGRRRFYYYGWNLGLTVPFRNSIGAAEEVGDNVNLRRLYKGPIMDRTKEFPNFCATPFVLHEGNLFKMWFAFADPWLFVDGKPAVACHVGYAESENGIDWVRSVTPAVENKETDHVVSTPFVIKENGVYKMWYSYRGKKYRIGYAESQDGKTFTRMDDQVGIGVSDTGWDSDMICYPHVFDLQGQRYMLYCGNEYGRTGLGLAVWA